MLNLFKKQNQEKQIVVERPRQVAIAEPEFQPDVTVEEIHREFMTASDILLGEIKSTLGEAGVERAALLDKCGFYGTREFNSSKDALSKKTFLQDNMLAYPNYKIITEDDVKRICQKYGLILCGAEKYTGFVPVKNMREISEFIDKYKKDIYYIKVDGKWSGGVSREIYENHNGERHTCKESLSLMICAPHRDIDTTGMKLSGHKAHYPDPVVLMPINFQRNYQTGEPSADGYVIITAWGDEASDELVVNERNN